MEFSKCRGSSRCFPHGRPICLWMTFFSRYSYSCFLGLDDPHGRIGVGSIFNSPSYIRFIPVYYSCKKFSFTFSNKIFWFFGGKIVFFLGGGGLKYNITIVNVFIIFVKFLGLIVVIWMKLAWFIEEKGSLRF